jgi:hypothetical protein
MSSTHEPVHLLEPSDLLEPLDLSDRQADLFYRSARAEPAATLPRGATRAGRSTPRSTESQRRSPLKSILMVAGALACFGAGTSLPQFQSFMRGDLAPEPTVGVGQPSAPVTDVAAKSEVAAKSDEAKPTSGEAKPASSATPSSNEPKADTALNATGTAPPAANSADRSGSAVDRGAQSTPVPSAPVATDAVANQRPCPKGDANCLEGGAASPAKDLTNADGTAARLTGPAQPVRQPATAAQPVRQAATPQDSEHVEARASNGQEASQGQEASNGQDVRTQMSRRTKATAQRERTDQRSIARRDVATVGRSSRTQDVNQASEPRWGFASDDVIANSSVRWQNRDEWRDRDGWRERVVDHDDVSPARSSGRRENLDRAANWRQDRPSEDRWQERNVDRTSNARRDRYEEHSRDGRRVRAGREDDFVMGRAERNDGPPMIFPFRFPW